MTGFGEVIESYGDLAEWWVRECGEEAKRTASSFGAGTFDADQAASAVVRVATLGLLGLFQLGGLAVGADRLSKAPSTLLPLRVEITPKNEKRTVGPVTFQHLDFGTPTFGAHAADKRVPENADHIMLETDVARIPSNGVYGGTLVLRDERGHEEEIAVTWEVN